nr:SDR family NAD(P)-dependent oxidoreductase [uncultured Carboxylicivirga sp.]
MKEALVVGGSNGIGLSIVNNLTDYRHIYIIDKVAPEIRLADNMSFEQFDLTSSDFSIFKKYNNINTLIITSGFGNIALFEDIDEQTIINSFAVNTTAVIRIIKHFYSQINSKNDFYCAVMGSISGMLSSPFFSVYGATKAAICKFIESVNVELDKAGSVNRILNVSPGTIKGTKFYNSDNDLSLTAPLAKEIIKNMYEKNDLFIPQFEEIYSSVLERYLYDFRAFGLQSYDYKVKNKR